MAKTFLKKTPDSTVLTKGRVEVEQSDDTPTKITVTLDSLNGTRASLITNIADMQTKLATIDTQIAGVDIEASKVILKQP